ncbi:MAG: signal peptidase I [Clostridia bacterium]|nr:signal peptidase I [Clostridia bacterium]
MIKVNKSLMEKAREKTKSDLVFLVVVAIVVLVMSVVVFLNTFVFFNVQIKGPSMEPTMYENDVLIANRYKKPTHGSIVIISGEKANGEWIIKRVIAMEGDTVEIRLDGYVYIRYAGKSEFTKLEESYVKEKGATLRLDWTSKTLTEGEIFYLGDNRGNSKDSRHSDFLTCDVSQIVGVVEDWSFALKNFNKKMSAIFN